MHQCREVLAMIGLRRVQIPHADNVLKPKGTGPVADALRGGSLG